MEVKRKAGGNVALSCQGLANASAPLDGVRIRTDCLREEAFCPRPLPSAGALL